MQALLEIPANIFFRHHTTRDNSSTLHGAVRAGSVEAVAAALDSSVIDIDRRNDKGDTALHIAVQASNTAMVSLLLARGASGFARDIAGYTAIQRAAAIGSDSMVNLLLSSLLAELKINVPQEEPGTEKTQSSKKSVFRTIFRKSKYGTSTSIVKPPAILPPEVHQALHAAIDSGHRTIVQLLIRRGVDVNSRSTTDGRTALSRAAFKGRIDIIRLLRANGANPSGTNTDGSTAAHIAAGNQDPLVFKEFGISTAAPDHNGLGVLHHAARTGCPETIQELIRNDLLENNQVWPYPSEDRDALWLSIKSRNIAASRTLIQEGWQCHFKHLVEAVVAEDLDQIELICSTRRSLFCNRDSLGRNIFHFCNNATLVVHFMKMFTTVLEGTTLLTEAARDGYTPFLEAVKKGNTQVALSIVALSPRQLWAPLQPPPPQPQMSVLKCACWHGNEVTIMVLIKALGAINIITSEYVLDAIVQDGRMMDHTVAVLDAIMQHRRDLSNGGQLNDGYDQILTSAASCGSVEVVQYFLSQQLEGVQWHNQFGRALVEASKQGHDEVVKCMLDSQQNSVALKMFSYDALREAAATGQDNVVRTLLAQPEKVGHLQKIEMWSLLETAATDGHLATLRVIYEASGCPSDGGAELLHDAIRKNKHNLLKSLLDIGVNFRILNKDGQSLLHAAIRMEHVEIARVLLNHGVPIDDCNDDGRSSLHQAVILDSGEMVSFLLEKGANAKLSDKQGCLPIHLAALFGSKKAMVQLCEDANGDDSMFYAKDLKGRTAANIAVQNASEALNVIYHKGPPSSSGSGLNILHEVSRDGNAEIVKLLLADKADTSHQDADGRTALHHAVESGHEEVSRLLIVAGIDLESKDNSGFTALAKATSLENLVLLKLLVNSGADINTRRNQESWTPAHEAAAQGKAEILEYLAKAGADLGARSATGKSALHLAIQSDCLEAAQILVTLGCPLETVDDKGITPLIEAVKGQKVEMAKILLEAGAGANYSHKQKYLPLIEASIVGNVELIELLISCGANVNEKDDLGNTALHQAANEGKELAARLLISEGADPVARRNNSLLPLHCAATKGHIGVADFLLSVLPDTEVVTKSGKTPLLMAAWFKCEKFIRFLATKRANISHKDKEGNDALIMANLIPPGLKFVSIATSETLLNLGMDVNCKNNTGNTPLTYAIWNVKSPELVELYLSRGADPNVCVTLKNGVKKYPLTHAAGTDRPARITSLLREYGANFRVKTEGHNLLQYATCCGNDQVIEDILQVAPDLLSETGEQGLTPLQMACELGHGKVIEKLLSMGADINAQSPKAAFSSPIHLAAQFCQPESVRILAGRGADVNKSTGSTLARKTPLLLAIAEDKPKRIETIEALLMNGAQVYRSGGDGWYPIHAAAKFGAVDALEMLIKYGADLNARSERDHAESALHVAVVNGKVAFAQALLSKGFPVNAVDKRGDTALMHAVITKQPKMWDLLLSTRGCAASIATPDGWTAVLLAVQHNVPAAIRSISRPGPMATVDPADFDEALNVAVRIRSVEATEALLAIVNHPCKRNKQGYSPLMAAAAMGYTNIIKLFRVEDVIGDRMEKPAYTALHMAAKSGERDAVVAVLQMVPRLLYATVDGQTATDIALANNETSIYYLLRDIQKIVKPERLSGLVQRWDLEKALDELGIKRP